MTQDIKNNDEKGYAIKPHHQLKNTKQKVDLLFKIRNILNLLFIIIAIIGVYLYLFSDKGETMASIILIIAVAFKISEVSLRIFHK